MSSLKSVGILTATIILLGGFIGANTILVRRKRLPLPPGPPPTSWLSGNAADMPRTHVWIKFTEWARKYGSIIYIRVRSNDIIVLSSYEAAVDLFEKRGSIYSQRPRRMMPLMMGWGKVIPFSAYDERWKRSRRQVNSAFSKKASSNYHTGQEKDVYRFLQRLLTNGEGFSEELNLLIGTIIMRITYGYEVTDIDDPFVTSSDAANASVIPTSVPGNYWVDTLPFLRHFPSWLPGMQFKIDAENGKQYPLRMVEAPYQWARRQMNEGHALTSFLANLLEKNQDGPEGEDIIKWTVGSMYNAGSHTTVGTLRNFVLAMILYPEVARKAREEIDRVVGIERLPGMADRPNLPYLECVFLETLRWYPLAPLALPHLVEREDQYEGFRIPANSTVYVNIYGITRDECMFPDPENFLPERFSETHAGPKPINPRDLVFGIGRRICPGNHIAEASIYLVMAGLIATMDISRARNEKGEEIEPEVVRTGGLVSQTVPFKCLIRPRSEQAINLIHASGLYAHE